MSLVRAVVVGTLRSVAAFLAGYVATWVAKEAARIMGRKIRG